MTHTATRAYQYFRRRFGGTVRRVTDRRPAAVILMYHRVRTEPFDPWEMCVSEAHFASQMDVLADQYRVLPLSRIEDALAGTAGGRRYVFITFDDGYLDNYQAAVPLLKERRLPATFFVPSSNLETRTVFWWEAIDSLFWGGDALPERIDLSAGSDRFCQTIGDGVRQPDPANESGWSANRQLPPTARCELYLNLCSWIKEKDPSIQAAITAQLLILGDYHRSRGEADAKMDLPQLEQLLSRGFEIGAHTRRHPALGYHPEAVQREEVLQGIRQLEAAIGRPVTSFAYPHGDFNELTLPLLREGGIRAACTVTHGPARPGADLLQLPRVFVKNTGADAFKRLLFNAFNS